jgi:peptide chain release factor subunit 1
MAATVSWEKLKELAGFRAARGRAVSLYLDLDPSVSPTAGDVATRANALLREGDRALAAQQELSHDQRAALKDDFDRIRRFMDDDFDRQGTRGLAVFADGPDNLWEVLPLTEQVPDAVKVRGELYLAPLVPLMGRGEGAIVAVVSRERGEVYRLRQGRLHELADHGEEQPSRHDQGGWSQANFQRHIDELSAEHMRRVAQSLNHEVRRLPLSHEARAALAGWTSAEAHASPAQLLELALPLLEGWRARAEAEALDKWREEAGRNGRAAAGWQHVLEAASDGRVELLLFQEGANRDAFQCPRCGRASTLDGSCPLDGTRLESRPDGLDVAVHQTLAHGGTVRAVGQRRDLEPVEGVGALLRY